MNVTSASPLPSSPRSDAAGGPVGSPAAQDAAGMDASGAGSAQDVGGKPALAFGRLLAQRMDPRAVTDLPPPDDGSTPTDAGRGIATTQGAAGATPWLAAGRIGEAVGPAADATDTLAVAVGAGTTASRKAPGSDATLAADGSPLEPQPKDGGDPVANDLAAQLALVSQWAALAVPAPSKEAAPPVDGGNGRLDVKGKLDAVRTASANGGAVLAAAAEQAPGRAVESGQVVAGPLFSRALAGVSMPSPGAKDPSTVHGQAEAATVDRPTAETLARKLDAIVAADRTDPAVATTLEAARHVNPASSTAIADGSIIQGVSAAAAQAVPAPNASPAPAASPAVVLREPLGTPAWSHEVGQATLRMAASALQSASLSLNPDHLGPVDVQLRIDQGVASITFTAAHAETRHALEASRSTLDQMFTDQGIKLGDCAVGDFGSSPRHADADGSQASASSRDNAARRREADAAAGDTTRASTVTTRLTRALGLVDTFA